MSPSHEWLPAVPADLTLSWFESVLKLKIKSVEQTRAIWGTGAKLFFTLTYDDDDDDTERPTYICVKGVFDPAMAAAQPWTILLVQNEALFYSVLAPQITRMGYPKAWWSGTSEKQGISIMNDLTSEGCVFKPMTEPWTVEQALEGVEQLAGLHSQYWGAQPVQPYAVNQYDPSMQFICAPWTAVTAERPAVPAEFKDGDRFNRLHNKYFLTRNPKFQTLLHGDTHVGNTYFTADGHPRWLDWSAYHVGSSFHDVSYFLIALSVDDRRQHDMTILQHYLDALHRFGGPQFKNTDEDVLIEFKRSFIANCIWLVCPYSLQPEESVRVLCERTVAAWRDYKVLDIIETQPDPVPKA
ncbi:kinase-like domain-containing protein [Roridomyces roridus]|uniref:Kinase-like domain-containing protein n=1 Tax=Roridomyces roridus TaxID=1738132 RepID=A0AAD7G1R6_9AGAR|nr:kinase-like domain-containing protein [Roridomyces roridus]